MKVIGRENGEVQDEKMRMKTNIPDLQAKGCGSSGSLLE